MTMAGGKGKLCSDISRHIDVNDFLGRKKNVAYTVQDVLLDFLLNTEII